ncbi:MAG: PDZ domain-containing protein [Magnetococcales bacterium]|nr:PDZ domain-containing protein [Magnetococcales bacterium]
MLPPFARRLLLLPLCLFLWPKAVQAAGWLGAAMQPPAGVQIAEIYKESPADQAGLRKGDLIRAVNETPLRSLDHWQEWLQQQPPGQEVVLTIWRRGEELRLKAILDNADDHLPENSRWTAASPDHPSSAARMPSPPAPPAIIEPAPPPPIPTPEPPRARLSTPPREPPPPPPATWLGIASNAGTGGVTILDVAPGSPAEQAELRRGDLLIAINRQAVTSPEALSQLLNRARPGEWVEITIEREGRVRMLQAQLTAPP